MTSDLKQFFEKLSPEWIVIKLQAEKCFDSKSKIREDGAAQIFYRPWVAPLNFGILLFPPAKMTWLSEFEARTGKIIPSSYKEVLQNMNGCFIYDMKLFGLPSSIYTTGLLNRAVLQQLDLGDANTFWIHGYNVDESLLYIGGRTYSFNENIGYFTDGENFLVIRTNGEIHANYSTFFEFLKNEIEIVEKMMLDQKNK